MNMHSIQLHSLRYDIFASLINYVKFDKKRRKIYIERDLVETKNI